ncbi:DUF4199 domain-containing protein [Mucilaginibacter terrenus]|uniref:DUF4199 domain-containing protein n=1 Tax=Mucilaginibacter terrenus TaxID=2482727 RepID=A0A3E2NTN5_9SPHI|nr:DUF4199 domain-containing protein [Mucilaginibacter terrenus]RFZ84373.1 DUF4199 domain-containing protein [Mucilaginibacter terrenus]
MENVAANPTKVATKWTLFYVLVSIVLTYTFEFLNIAPESPLKYISYIPFIAFLFLAQKEFKDQLGGYITFGQAFTTGFRYSLFSGLLLAIFVYLYLAVLSPGMLAHSLEQQQQVMADKGMSQDQIDKALEIGKKWGPLFGMIATALGSLIFGCIISLIGAAIFKKERSVYDVQDSNPDATV